MTLRTIESEFSTILKAQVQEEHPINLEANGPLMTPVHPKLLWAQLLYQHKIDERQNIVIPSWSYDCFRDLQEAESRHPEINLKFIGRPWNVYEFMQGTSPSALIDFQAWGVVAISKSQEIVFSDGRELHHYALPVWINYALSPELWGPHGKWIRFHHELSTVLSGHQLLRSHSSLGRYVLEPKAQKLESFGFKGTMLDDSYLLVLPWSFSLSALKKLTQTIEQEF